MSKCLIWIIIGVLLLVLIFVLIAAQRLYFADDIAYVGSAANPLSINTGDILAIGYRNTFGLFVTACTGSLWSHTSVAWRCPITDELYVFEQARYDDKYAGVYRIPFALWLRINKKHHICHLKLQGTPVDPHVMSSICQSMENIKTKFNVDLLKYVTTQPYIDDPTKKSYTCYEVTTLLLQRLGIVAKKLSCGAYFPRHIVGRQMHMEFGFSYSKPVLLWKQEESVLQPSLIEL